MTRLRIKTSSWLIEHQDLWLADQRACNCEAALHSTTQSINLDGALICELSKFEKLFNLWLNELLGESKVATIYIEVLFHREGSIQVICLRDNAEVGLNLRSKLLRILAQDGDLAIRTGQSRRDNPHGRGLSSAIWP